jgi:hypothetical protein
VAAYLAECAGAKRPRRVPVWLARLLAGDVAVTMMTQGRGFSNAKAKRELGWELQYPSWRQGLPGVADVTRTEQFDELRPLLFAIAYRILGSVSDGRGRGPGDLAAVPSPSATEPTSAPRRSSRRSVTRLSIDVLRSGAGAT